MACEHVSLSLSLFLFSPHVAGVSFIHFFRCLLFFIRYIFFFLAIFFCSAVDEMCFGLCVCGGRACANRMTRPKTDEPVADKPTRGGLSLEEISMLPQQTGNGSGPMEQCCICMDDMTSRQSITRLPACLHTFHRYVSFVCTYSYQVRF